MKLIVVWTYSCDGVCCPRVTLSEIMCEIMASNMTLLGLVSLSVILRALTVFVGLHSVTLRHRPPPVSFHMHLRCISLMMPYYTVLFGYPCGENIDLDKIVTWFILGLVSRGERPGSSLY